MPFVFLFIFYYSTHCVFAISMSSSRGKSTNLFGAFPDDDLDVDAPLASVATTGVSPPRDRGSGEVVKTEGRFGGLDASGMFGMLPASGVEKGDMDDILAPGVGKEGGHVRCAPSKGQGRCECFGRPSQGGGSCLEEAGGI